jgi:predicted RNase H-like HicB family nuclease
MQTITVNIDWENNYGAYSEEVSGCIATNKTLEGVKQAYTEAFEFHLAGLRADGDEITAAMQGKYKLDYVLNVRALLHYFEGVLTRSALSRVTGINERQLGHYITGHRKPRPEQRKKIVEGLHRIGKEINSVV